MDHATADLSDDHPEAQVVPADALRDFGGRRRFHGPVTTLRVHEDNVLVRQALEEAGEGRVLVVDGGGSTRCALLGDRLGGLAVEMRDEPVHFAGATFRPGEHLWADEDGIVVVGE